MREKWFTDKQFLDREDLNLIQNYSSLEMQEVSGEALEVLLRIEQLTRRLRPMGDDEQRWLWLPIPGKRRQWLQVVSSQYMDRHFLQLRLEEAYFLLLTNSKVMASERCQVWEANIVPLLTHIEEYLSETISWIERETDRYNGYIEQQLNPVFRTGLIPHSQLEAYCPSSYLNGFDLEAAVALFKNPPKPYVYQQLTLREYRKIRRIAHEAVYGSCGGSDDEVLRYSTGIREMLDFNLDDPEDLKRWENRIASFHGLDVVYARVHLVPRSTPGGTVLSLWTHTIGFITAMIQVALKLTEAGYPPQLGDAEMITSILERKDRIRITTHPSYYLRSGDTYIEQQLPLKSELGTKRFNELVRSIQWDPIEKVLPL